MTHRVRGAFHEPFAVIRQFDRPASRVGDRRELAFFVIAHAGFIAVAFHNAFKQARVGELVDDLVAHRQRIAFGAVPGQFVGRPFRRDEMAFFFGERDRRAFFLHHIHGMSFRVERRCSP